ncbi:hypothetical protein ACFFSW_24325 [Saccharothrix longispora]|uniref:Methyltransferase family protein n=1 Tax=Saccharothrix longispora TaxID=33920 RepID=A0ABU1PXI8_9PSEU|nr:hypothetical protein [Saccharothrix longispora]MDR6595357.1 hypothetical protein [Saccharothrix longispora]
MTAAQDLVPLPEDPLAEVVAAVLGAGRHSVLDLLDVVRHLGGDPVDVVRAGDDLLPRLAHENALDQALLLARQALRPGGLFVASVPELDRLSRMRPTAPPPRVSGRGADRQVTVQLWDWSPDGESYSLEVVRLVRGPGQWEVASSVATRHRVLSPEQISASLLEAGFGAVQRLSPAECGHPLPVWVAVAPG